MMKRPQALLRYGLKYNPFLPEVPIAACLCTPDIEHFIWRAENLARTGGFAQVDGDPGHGKSVALRLLVQRLEQRPDLVCHTVTRPQGSLADFYRELGDLYDVAIRPHNRWLGAKALRARWREHLESALHRTVVVIDEAQESQSSVLNELRLLSATDLDSSSLLTVILAGDERLAMKLHTTQLAALGSRVRVRLRLRERSPESLLEILEHRLREAGNPQLLSTDLARTLCERALGNLRTLMNMASELLDAAQHRDLERLDEKLFLETFGAAPGKARRRARAGSKR